MKRTKSSIWKSFAVAFSGIWEAICTERNLRIHLTATVYVIALSAFLKLARLEYAVLFLTCGAVIALELINTALERLCDFTESEHNEKIGLIKDISAGAVLVAAIFSVGVGIALFATPKLIAFFKSFLQKPYLFVILAATLVLAYFFIAKGPREIALQIKRHFEDKK